MRINVKHPVAENLRVIKGVFSLGLLFGLDLLGDGIPPYFIGEK